MILHYIFIYLINNHMNSTQNRFSKSNDLSLLLNLTN